MARLTGTLPPPLKWAGGKRWLVPHLRPIWAANLARRWVEPFCGGLAAPLGLRPERALLNDINPHLINFYRWLKRGLCLSEPLDNRANDPDVYYRQRARFNALIASAEGRQSAEAAALFYYLNRTGYNGLCRFNRRGAFNVPFGRYKTLNYVSDFAPYRAAFAGWTFTSADFETLPLRHDDFIYADPPYDVEFTSYSKEPFGWDEQVRMAEWLARHPGPVVISNQATDRIITVYRDLGFDLLFLDAPRRISCTGDRAPAREVLGLRHIDLALTGPLARSSTALQAHF